MNAYDFDGTIYDGDSTVDFYLFCLRRDPSLVRFLPGQVLAAAPFLLGAKDRTWFKGRFFSFLNGIKDVDQWVSDFWDRNLHKIYPWYFELRCCDDVVTSASPFFLLGSACVRLEVGVPIASEVDTRTGVLLSPNNRGQEKVRRFRERFGASEVNRFYSDSLSDLPMARIAREAFLVRRGSPTMWEL